MRVVVDGNNVMGTTPDGWWRDRPAAVRRLLGRLQRFAAANPDRPVILVLDVPQADLPEGDHGGVTIRYATRRGRNAGDDRILELLEAGDDVVTSDRALAEAVVETEGVTVTGARTFLARLDGGAEG